MEVDETGPIASTILAKLGDKKPKIPPTCLEVLRDGVAAFGARAFPVKELVTALGPVLEGSNGPAREVAMLLLVDIFRWIGKTPLHSLLEKLRSAQTSEFDRMCAEKEGEPRPTPSLWLRKERPLPGSEAATGTGLKPESLDSREFVDEVDLAKRLKSSDFAKLVAEEKWSEQLNGLQIVIDALGPAPKIKSGCDVSDVLSACKGFLRAGHVQVQVSTLRVIALLADGMRQEFGSYVRPMLQSIILKCKEKRLIPEVQAALTVIIKYCCSFESMLEDVKEQIVNKKVPTYGRACLLEFTTQTLVETPDRVSIDCLKPLAEACSSCCEDSDPKIRECCAFALAALLKLVKSKGKSASDANRVLLALENSCPRIFKRMQEGATGAAPPASTSASSAPAVKKADDEPTSKRPQTASTATASSAPAPKKVTASASAVAKKAPATSSSNAADDDAVEELSLSLEDAITALAVLEVPGWDGSIQTQMDSEKWQDKVEALESISKAILERKVGGQISSALVVYLSSKTKTFKISNVNILKCVIQTACNAAQTVGDVKFSKAAAWTLLKEFGDKLSDKKTKEPVEALLTALGEATSSVFVVRRMKVVMDKVKAPLAHQYYLEWLKQAIKDFGASSFPVTVLAQFCAAEMDNKDSKVRTAAVEVFGALYHQLGPRMQSMAFSEDTKPQLKALIETEFAKVGYDPAAAASATRKGDDSGAAAGAIPRQDILSLLDKNIMSELNLIEGKTSWTNRKVALEAIVSACERSGHFLDPTKGAQELIRALKARLNDTQANLKPLAAAAIGHIIASMETNAACKMLRIIADPLLAGLADNKKGMRDAAVSALQMAVTLNKGGENALGEPSILAVLVTPICEALVNPVGRQELLEWALKQHEMLRGDVSELVVPLVLSLQDKTAAVRGVTEQLLMALSARSAVSRMSIEKATRDLPPAVKRTLTGTVDKILAAFGSAKMDMASSGVSAADVPPPSAKMIAPETSDPALPPPPPVAQVEKEKEVVPVASIVEEQQATVQAPPSPVRDSWLLKKTNKSKRLDDFFRLNWPQPPEDPSDTEMNVLRSTWEPLMSPDLSSLVFPVTKGGALLNQDSFIPAATELSNQLQGPHALQHVDLILRWCCYVIGVRESSTGLLKVLQLIISCFSLVQKSADGAMLHDSEVQSIFPHLIDKSGHKSERHKLQFKAAIAAAGAVIAPSKVNLHLLSGLSCKNKKTRVVCIEEILRVVDVAGASSLGRTGVKEIGSFLDSKDNDALGRNACLELCYALYVSLGDLPKLMKLLGDLSERSVSLIDDRIKQKNKNAPNALKTAPTSSIQASSAASTTTTSILSTTPESRRPPVVHSAKEEQEKSPFRLEMTPPEDTIGGDSVAHPRGAATGVTPVALGMDEEDTGLAPSWSKTPGPVTVRSNRNTTPRVEKIAEIEYATASLTPGSAKRLDRAIAASATATAEIEDVYNEIADKIDRLLLDDRSDLMLESDPVHEQAVDYIKILHSIVTGEWIKEKLPEDDALLRAHSNALTSRMVACLGRAFDKPVLMNMGSTGSHLNFDFDLASCAISALYMMIKRSDIVQQLQSQTILSIFRECFRRLVDDRITNTEDEAAVQMVRALNLILFKLAAELGAGNALVALLDVVGSCKENSESMHLPVVCAKPTSRLLQHILTEEVKRPQPFTVPSADPALLLNKLHDFFGSYANAAPNGEAEELAFSCGKTVLSEMIKAHSVKTILALASSAGIVSSSALVKLTAKMGGVLVETDPELQRRVVSLIDDITTARDKTAPIRQLHQLKKQHPDLDINQYLQRISPVFRRFVLDTVSRFDEECLGIGGDEKENTISASGVAPASAMTVNTESSSEAMRILEGIKSRTSALKPLAGENSALSTSVGEKLKMPSMLSTEEPRQGE